MSAHELIEQAVNNPKVALATPVTTTLIGIATVQSWLTLLSMVIGVAISLVLLNNHLIKRRILIRQEELLNKTGNLRGDLET
jgi:uncharacterized membrane protein SpoIIM required for sporulation